MKEPIQYEGRNPVREALRTGKDIDKIYIASGSLPSLGQIIALARQNGIAISEIPRRELDKRSLTGAHQGVIAVCSAVSYATVDDILNIAAQKGEDPFIIILDQIEDPHNLGAIIRSANASGAHGVIITKHRSAGLTPTVAKTSAGAIEYTRVAKVTNLASTLDYLKNKGLWIYGAAAGEANMYTSTNMTGPIALVIGNEGRGMGSLITTRCDFLVSIPMIGEIESLNASVAASLLMYEIVRQRTAAK